MKNLKSRIRSGETLIGCWLNLGSSVTAEIVGTAGFDWVLIDLEHGTGTDKDVLHQLLLIIGQHVLHNVKGKFCILGVEEANEL